ncbi:Uma2 family endonuclease [Tolypothrix sp. VBCCA 56010]|uniref:Uma2 family endonuclease n=1 Tax=Tolypothrix sp. VBCCA 56010 TaxID=3137731 RepID=UPI003D7D15CF
MRSRFHDYIQRLHGTMPLLGIDHWVDLGKLFNANANIEKVIEETLLLPIAEIEKCFCAIASEYAALEIPEYWIVDLIESKVTVLLWEEGLYEQNEFFVNQQLLSSTFPELCITVEQILTAGNISEKIVSLFILSSKRRAIA